MGADIQSAVRRFVPNNPPLSKLVIKILNQTFRVRELPLDLVRMTVQRAFELTRDLEIEIESNVFEEKLLFFVQQIKPRFLAKIQQQRQQARKQSW